MSGLKRLLCLAMAAVALLEVDGENIKMCGRDLIRHAVSYCGNSRLKRAVLMMEGPEHEDQRDRASSSQVQGEDVSPGPAPVPPHTDGRGEESGEREDVVSLVSRWLPLSARQRRTALKISDLCCEKGCSKQELIQFC